MNLLLFQKKRLSKGISLALDFTSGVLDSRVTFTRASSGTRVNSSGVIESVASNLPRFDYDPVTLAPKGLLIEEQRTNLLLQSAAFDVTPWGTALGSVTSNAAVAPDGTSTADTITSTGGGVFQSISGTVATTVYTASIYVKYIGGGGQLTFGFNANPASARANFNIQTGALVTIDANATSATITSVGGGWYRCSVTATVTSTSTIIVDYSLTSGTSWYSWGAQLEAGAFPTSHIPTTSATVTRAADNASMVGSNFSSWYNQSAGTIYSQWMLGGDNTSVNVYNINDTTIANYIRNRYGSAGTANDNAVTVSSVVQQTLTATNQVALYAMYKNAMAYKQNDFARSANGTLITGSTGNIPVVSQMNIGGIGVGDYLNGHIQSIKYYPTRLPNADLQRLTR